MIMKLVIHPGWPKTGTSALQDYFVRNYENYRRERVVYPLAGRYIDNAHHGLALSLQPRPGLTCEMDASELIRKIEEESRDAETVIISSELSPLYFNIDIMSKFLCNFKEVALLFTLRPQSDLFSSLMKQWIKDPAIILGLSPMELLREHSSTLNYEAEIERWTSSVPSHVALSVNLVTYSSDRLIQSVLGSLGLPAMPELGTKSNSSITDLAAAVLYCLESKLAGVGCDERTHLISLASELLDSTPLRHQLLSPEMHSVITAIYARSNNSLAQQYLAKPNLFDEEPVFRDEHLSYETVSSLAEVVWSSHNKIYASIV